MSATDDKIKSLIAIIQATKEKMKNCRWKGDVKKYRREIAEGEILLRKLGYKCSTGEPDSSQTSDEGCGARLCLANGATKSPSTPEVALWSKSE